MNPYQNVPDSRPTCHAAWMRARGQLPGYGTFTGQMGHRHSRNCLINASIASCAAPAALRQQRGHKRAKRAICISGPTARPIPAQGIALGTMRQRIPSPERATHPQANRVIFGSIGSPSTTPGNGSSMAQMAHPAALSPVPPASCVLSLCLISAFQLFSVSAFSP